jgi:hypothetical protein
VVALNESVCGSADVSSCSAHVGIDGNKIVDRIAKESAASGNLYRGGALECDLCHRMKSCLLMDWQRI